MLANACHDKCLTALSRSDQCWTNSASCSRSWYTVERAAVSVGTKMSTDMRIRIHICVHIWVANLSRRVI